MLILLLHILRQQIMESTLLQKQLAILIGIQIYYFSLPIPILRMSNYLRTYYPYFTSLLYNNHFSI